MSRAIFNAVSRFLGDDSGPTAVEYAVMIAFIIVACISAIGLIGDITAKSLFDSSSRINGAAGRVGPIVGPR